MKLTAPLLLCKMGDFWQDGDVYNSFTEPKHARKSYHSDNDEWASAQLCTEDYINGLYKTRRATDKRKVDWKRIWKFFDKALDFSDIDWGGPDEQKVLLVYLIGLFLGLKGLVSVEDKLVKVLVSFYDKPTPHREDAEMEKEWMVSLVKRWRVLPANRLADKLERKFKKVDVFRGLKCQCNPCKPWEKPVKGVTKLRTPIGNPVPAYTFETK